MHLAVDGIGARRGGTATVLLSLLEAALAADAISRVTVFAAPERTRVFSFPCSPKLVVREKPVASSVMAARLWWFWKGLAKEVERIGADLLICLNGGGYQPPGVVGGTLLQQPVPFSREAMQCYGLFRRLRFKLMREAMRHSCKRCSLVFVQTPTMREWVHRDFSVPLHKIHVALPTPPPMTDSAPSERLEPMRRHPPTDRLLLVGDFYPHKNPVIAAKGLQEVRRSRPSARLFVTYDRSHPVCQLPGVIGLGSLSRAEVQEAYRLATALVMPSIVETVGLPLLEAAQAGVPVLAADRPYAHDISADAAAYFDPTSPDDFAQKTVALLGDDDLRRTLVERGRARVSLLAKGRPYLGMLEALLGTSSSPG